MEWNAAASCHLQGTGQSSAPCHSIPSRHSNFPSEITQSASITLQCNPTSFNDPPKAAPGPTPTFWGRRRLQTEKDARLRLLSIPCLEQLTGNTESPPFSGHVIMGTSKCGGSPASQISQWALTTAACFCEGKELGLRWVSSGNTEDSFSQGVESEMPLPWFLCLLRNTVATPVPK